MNTGSSLSIWQVTREYAGIAEAGGVKNVACSLSENLASLGNDVTVFIPRYGCTEFPSSAVYSSLPYKAAVEAGGAVHHVSFGQLLLAGVRIVMIESLLFIEKQAVYTYTAEEEAADPWHVRGTGHHDFQLMNTVFQKAVLEYAVLSGEIPQIIHCQDAAAALVPVFAHSFNKYSLIAEKSKFVVTVHNAGPGYHHAFNSIQEAKYFTHIDIHILSKGVFSGRVEPFLLAYDYSVFTTVSPWYAQELCCAEFPHSDGLSKEFAQRNYTVHGITNGIDYERYDPTDTSKSLLPYPFDPSTGSLGGKLSVQKDFISSLKKDSVIDGIDLFGGITPGENDVVFSYHGRLVWQKGLHILSDAAEKVLQLCPDAKFIITGQGQKDLDERQIELAGKYSGRYVFLRGYTRSTARLSVAASDFIVLPSVFEPCGLEDLIAQIFGTIPVAHRTGGLNKIIHGETGFTYADNSPDALADILCHVYSLKKKKSALLNTIIKNAAVSVRENYSWSSVVQNGFIPLYRKMLKK